MTLAPFHPSDTPELRKARGAFFTPQPIVAFLADWAIRDATDSVFEPSAGDAEFLVESVRRLRNLSDDPAFEPTVHGVEIHKHSAQVGRGRVREAGGRPRIHVNDFFMIDSARKYAAVIGNPPYVRYQDWSGVARLRSREAALRSGVSLTGLASSWAAFVIQGSSILRDGGRLGLVLPAELLSVNYAAPVRQFLFDHFRSLEIVLFEEQIFPEAEADVVLLLADGYNQGPTDHATIRQAKNAAGLAELELGMQWAPVDPAGKWTGAGLVSPAATMPLARLTAENFFTDLESWGDTTLGMVTGNNRYFALSAARIKELGIHRNELLRLSPPGSSHLRGLVLSDDMLTRLAREGKATRLFYPAAQPSAEAQAYIDAGHAAGVDQAYKCQVRKTWYRVPLVAPADLLLTCMNADTPRLTTNLAGVRHLNSIHGVYLNDDVRELGWELLPLASLNSITLLNAEMVGRAYGGGILKLEPKEADRWMMPSPELVSSRADALRAIRDKVARKLQGGQLLDAVELVDHALLLDAGHLTTEEINHVRVAHTELTRRRTTRGKRG
ncbi:Eco57I restriction-modification methylase domain-containing protein [Cryobacterium psychrophilum]|uniref:site-specific DNA-methyltransferase (adenine-specific) n=1 Tax=Cryobacterium psychrophilum TaxID=41988 RepID=A0A4Y8KIG5_9MICO|nr:class I SAM-dependent methyltransferase [Cryobacterium psychrophilum]TDW26908.1 N-6 DNA methylase [Cryobacterium psychrophilum]TFD75316.1 class I SAM-dependent methyltransferase [Cryobacterium psychrophilum]